MSYLGIFGLKFEKKEKRKLKSASLNLSCCKVWCKNKKSLNLGPKIIDLGIFGLGFENNIFIFEISTLDFA